MCVYRFLFEHLESTPGSGIARSLPAYKHRLGLPMGPWLAAVPWQGPLRVTLSHGCCTQGIQVLDTVSSPSCPLPNPPLWLWMKSLLPPPCPPPPHHTGCLGFLGHGSPSVRWAPILCPCLKWQWTLSPQFPPVMREDADSSPQGRDQGWGVRQSRTWGGGSPEGWQEALLHLPSPPSPPSPLLSPSPFPSFPSPSP